MILSNGKAFVLLLDWYCEEERGPELSISGSKLKLTEKTWELLICVFLVRPEAILKCK